MAAPGVFKWKFVWQDEAIDRFSVNALEILSRKAVETLVQTSIDRWEPPRGEGPRWRSIENNTLRLIEIMRARRSCCLSRLCRSILNFYQSVHTNIDGQLTAIFQIQKQRNRIKIGLFTCTKNNRTVKICKKNKSSITVQDAFKIPVDSKRKLC